MLALPLGCVTTGMMLPHTSAGKTPSTGLTAGPFSFGTPLPLMMAVGMNRAAVYGANRLPVARQTRTAEPSPCPPSSSVPSSPWPPFSPLGNVSVSDVSVSGVSVGNVSVSGVSVGGVSVGGELKSPPPGGVAPPSLPGP